MSSHPQIIGHTVMPTLIEEELMLALPLKKGALVIYPLKCKRVHLVGSKNTPKTVNRVNKSLYVAFKAPRKRRVAKSKGSGVGQSDNLQIVVVVDGARVHPSA